MDIHCQRTPRQHQQQNVAFMQANIQIMKFHNNLSMPYPKLSMIRNKIKHHQNYHSCFPPASLWGSHLSINPETVVSYPSEDHYRMEDSLSRATNQSHLLTACHCKDGLGDPNHVHTHQLPTLPWAWGAHPWVGPHARNLDPSVCFGLDACC